MVLTDQTTIVQMFTGTDRRNYALMLIKEHLCFPDSTRRGDAEAGDNNQVQVALVFIPFS